jgi:hypothetical protein
VFSKLQTMQKVAALVLFISIVLFQIPAQAQEPRYAKGTLGITDANLIDQLMLTVDGIGGNARDLLQQQSVKPYMMPVRKVGTRGADWSYALASCLEFYVNLDQNYKLNLSPDYIALNLENANRTVSLVEAFRFLVEQGTVNAAIVPYDARTLTDAVYSTQKFRINNYLHIFREETPGRQRVYESRKALMKGNPVLIELRAPETIKNFNGKTWSSNETGTVQVSLVIVSYNEIERAFEVMSCWGRTWGTNGYAWIDYDTFGKYAVNGYVILPERP